jgi:putative tryptophan/tyrosine transport system substrate-binding protein
MVTLGTAAALAAKAATKSIPIVFSIASDPVKHGLVDNLNRPGGNATGVSVLLHLITAKQFEVLHETMAKTDLIGLLVNPTNPSSDSDIKEAEAAAASLGHKVIVVRAREQNNLETAFATLIDQRVGALLVAADLFLFSQIDQIVALAARHQLPTLCAYRDCPAASGLMSYGVNIADAHRLQGVYAGRILKGEKPVDLPVQQSAKVELVVNLKTAKALGLTIPSSILFRADEVIE